ncbi:MAG: aspartyl/glutamyl-tRNA amidotransferase subunit A [Elusimicrobia bacterium RIFCSPLOWO2_01_FULL_54_10]|nr:MAG: aspartyl/glutamyl-tRNA amidotransferase subunit A [Elusimicrobia bacterium RIFCSPLOWO2_01_FULL_54_10]
MNMSALSACEIAAKVRKKEISALEVAKGFLENAKKQDPRLKVFIKIHGDPFMASAEALDEKIRTGGAPGRLAGVPVAIKDNMNVDGWETTCASKILEGFKATYDATAIKKLKAEDALLLGKTNLDEFAMGSSTENSAFFTTKNPWDISRVPGGSSGGSAAAVAAGITPLSLGSDTGGSIRQPASFCGVLGLKPTYGRVSRFGLVAFASSLDQIGPFARDAQDLALLLSVISGKDPMDSTSSDEPVPDYAAALAKGTGPLKLGVPKEYFAKGLDAEIKEKVLAAVKVFEKAGAKIEDVSLPHMSSAIEVYYILAPSEASANLARFDGIRYGHRTKEAKNLLELYEKSRDEGFGPEVKRRIMLGTYALSSGYYDAFYLKAQKVRTLICQDFEAAFKKVDALITPTAPTPAFKIGDKTSDPLQMYLSDVYTISCNLAGIPGMSVPCGFSKEKLPVGFQILGRPFEEARMLQMAAFYQSQTAWHKETPPLN